MDFENLNRLNGLVNTLSANMLPLTNKKINMPIYLRVYSIIVWTIELIYLTICILGLLHVPKERALQDSTVNIVVTLEVFLMIIYLSNRKTMLRRFIEKMNNTFAIGNETLKFITIQTLKPLEKPLKVYTIASIGTVIIWTALPLVQIFNKNEFYYVDYRIPAVLSKEPYSVNIFIGGVVLECFGALFAIARKVSLDLYTMHLILLMTAQYKYLRFQFQAILQSKLESLKGSNNDAAQRNVSCKGKNSIKQELRLLTYHHGIVVEMAVILKRLLSPNVGILYIDNIFRLCFLSFMIITINSVHFEKCLVALYAVGAVIQLYILCFCIQQLLEASTTIMDDAFHAKWYVHGVPLERVVAIMTLASKLECRLSIFRSIDLTLPSFMSILNQAYSVCLLFLKSRQN
ncbi:uncharacterized protein LOC143348466 [Colletes latitarsis]|uniref:uncharacterized protein LOC143348466 n=1 Tax=Colletes latitarsis TaxID=2605962 RepID=UPI00403750AE